MLRKHRRAKPPRGRIGAMYIGVGTLVVILIIVVLVLLLRRGRV